MARTPFTSMSMPSTSKMPNMHAFNDYSRVYTLGITGARALTRTLSLRGTAKRLPLAAASIRAYCRHPL